MQGLSCYPKKTKPCIKKTLIFPLYFNFTSSNGETLTPLRGKCFCCSVFLPRHRYWPPVWPGDRKRAEKRDWPLSPGSDHLTAALWDHMSSAKRRTYPYNLCKWNCSISSNKMSGCLWGSHLVLKQEEKQICFQRNITTLTEPKRHVWVFVTYS